MRILSIVRFEDDDPKTVRNTPSKTDFVLLKLVSKDKKTIERTKVKIFERITAASVQLSIPFPVHGDEILKDKKNMVWDSLTFLCHAAQTRYLYKQCKS